jgi:hypothetical protein
MLFPTGLKYNFTHTLKLHNEELHNLYSSPSIIRMIKSWRIRLAGHVARMGRRGMHRGYWWKARRKETTGKTKT